MTAESKQALSLLTAEAVRDRARQMLETGFRDELFHFNVDLERMDAVADTVLAVTRSRYPTLDVPLHARWRHFMVDGDDRWALYTRKAPWRHPFDRARAEFDLAVISVLLDAGAGGTWRYRDPLTGLCLSRSEGLALASLNMFVSGAFSRCSDDPLRVDADAISTLPVSVLNDAFQIDERNNLIGLDGRLDLLRRLGQLVSARTDIFGLMDTPRPGGLFDRLAALSENGVISARTLLSEVLVQFGPVWPLRISLAGTSLGDCWRHPAIKTADATNGLVPFHKLSQWLVYSLIEPLQRAGIQVTDLKDLTGLAEYRNGGLFLDCGVLRLRDSLDAERLHGPASFLVVEWRALTAALLDVLAESFSRRTDTTRNLGVLANLLEGGTWAAGRKIALQRRPSGEPPIRVVTDGTIF